MKIYVASSWRNLMYPGIVHILKRCGHDVYDFRAPTSAFRWSDIDPAWQRWTPEQYREALKHPRAERGYQTDIAALQTCDVCVLALPCGRSANWEFGYAMGQGKRGVVVMLGPEEPELMYREAQIVTSIDELFDLFGRDVGQADHAFYQDRTPRTVGRCDFTSENGDYCGEPVEKHVMAPTGYEPPGFGAK